MIDRKYPSILRKQGYTIDDSCYPYFAYKGLRWAPDEFSYAYTDMEEELLKALKKARSKIVREGVRDYISKLIISIINKYKES